MTTNLLNSLNAMSTLDMSWGIFIVTALPTVLAILGVYLRMFTRRTEQCQMDDAHFRNILLGTKQIEARLNHDKWAQLKTGDYLSMTNKTTGQKVCKHITCIANYPDFRSFLNDHLNLALPTHSTVDQGMAQVYDEIYKSRDKQQIIRDHGIRAFLVRLVR